MLFFAAWAIATLFVGAEVKGARRWIVLAGLNIQPSEFLKPLFVVTIAWLFSLGQQDRSLPVIPLSTILLLMRDTGARVHLCRLSSAESVNMVREDPLVRQMNHFVKVIQGHEQPRVSVQDGLLNLQVTEAIQHAAETGALVTLPPLPAMA